jgi:hypothetical protein
VTDALERQLTLLGIGMTIALLKNVREPGSALM